MSSHQHQRPLERIAGVEDDKGYRIGGFFPVHLGDVLGNSEGRYRVIHKLGNGVSATIFTAGPHMTEMSALVFFARMVAPHPNVLTFCSYFTVEGVNGNHICFVFPFLGPTVKSTRPSAALLRCRFPIDFKRFNPGLLSGDICIADFGQSFKIENDNPGMPPMKLSFLAPESFFKSPRLPTSDVWGVGCVIFELYTGRVLFPALNESVHQVIAAIVETLGPLPADWKGYLGHQAGPVLGDDGELVIWPERDFWFDPNLMPNRPLEGQIDYSCSWIPEHKRGLFLQLLTGALCFNHTARLTPAEVAANPWFSQTDEPEEGGREDDEEKEDE
ncbi:kinase-like domain-containing protein [Lasiosphaeria miniovina]|uniref:Kinase-like domain-containing protein n=1 Tax=Lasiosphaeria miniovina TaxID=1954250 RepID=A0AA40DJG7_9PEZI|nr:kinase-like domain-containing protein [Lasiosphaeria miniovina]KAK0703641.1 kinase-like domain-containing protein [Lasiosphaeria miniovina]